MRIDEVKDIQKNDILYYKGKLYFFKSIEDNEHLVISISEKSNYGFPARIDLVFKTDNRIKPNESVDVKKNRIKEILRTKGLI